MDLKKLRISLIDEVQKIAAKDDHTLEMYAVAAIRNKGGIDKEMAQEYLIKSETRRKVSDEVISLLWKYLPDDQGKINEVYENGKLTNMTIYPPGTK